MLVHARDLDGPEAEWRVRQMDFALKQARLALNMDETPIGAVVFHEGEPIAVGRNEMERLDDATAHAEIQAIRAAGQALGDWRLEGCELVVTIEPCPMCVGAILHARVETLIFGARSPRWGAVVSRCCLLEDPPFNHRTNAIEGIQSDLCATLLQTYFRDRRASSQKNV